MLIALLAVLGADLIVIVILVGVLLIRRRWVRRQQGAFRGAVRVADGDVSGLKRKWKRGYGRWVSNVLVWTKAPFLFRDQLVVAEALVGEVRAAQPGEVKRLGKHPIVVPLTVEGGGRLEVAVADGQQDWMRAPSETLVAASDADG